MSQYKYAEIADTIYFWFAANETTGTAGDGATPLYDVRLAGALSTAAPTASGTPTLLSHADYSPGLFEIAIDTTGQAAGEYAVFCTLTISTVNPAGFCGSYKLRTAVTAIDPVLDTVLADTNELQINQGNWLTATGFATPTNITAATGITVATNSDKTGYTVSTVSDKTGYVLSSTGADLILKNATFVQAIVAAINEFTTYGLTAINTLLVTTGIKTATTAAPIDMALNSTVAKDATVSKPGTAQTITPPADMALNSTVGKETTLTTIVEYIDTEIGTIITNIAALPTDADINAACDTAITDAALATAANLAVVDGVVDAIKLKTDTINGAGSLVWTYALTDSVSSLPIPDVTVRLTSDSAGTVTLRTATTNSLGVATFYFDPADSGMTIYIFNTKAGYNFAMDTEVLS